MHSLTGLLDQAANLSAGRVSLRHRRARDGVDSVAFKDYGVQTNPVAQTRCDGWFDRADKRPLTADDLHVCRQLIDGLPRLRRKCLRLHLLTGGQRIEPLVRLRLSDVRADSITIYDSNGRPGQGARAHTEKIIKAAARDLQAFERAGDDVFATTKGVKPISRATVSSMLVALELKIGEFKLEHASKMAFHLKLLNEKEQAPDDAPSIGNILCGEKDNLEVWFALKSKTRPTSVADYPLKCALPAKLRGRLPAAKPLEDTMREVIPGSL